MLRIAPQDKGYRDKHLGELRPYPIVSQRMASVMQDGLMSLGASPYNAGRMARSLRDLAMVTPLGIPIAAGDAVQANARGDGLGR